MPKVAIVADWITNLGGAERVVEQMHLAFPEAPIYTSVYNSDALPQFKDADVRTSYLQKIPVLHKKHQLLLPLMPRAFESFDLREYDVVISSSFACAKGVITQTGTKHICYCHNPMRYVWDESHAFMERYSWPKPIKWLGGRFLHKLRMWDRVAAARPDVYVANSEFVARRIQKYYHRDAQVLYPGIELPQLVDVEQQDYFLVVGRLTAQKYIDLVVKVFNKLKLPLKIVGEGPARAELESLNQSERTEFLGFVSDSQLQELYAGAQALIFPQCEDFGIVPLEAQAQGCPVIAYAAGGALETVYAAKDGGLLFKEQSLSGLETAITEFQQENQAKTAKIRQNVEKFSAAEFRKKLKQLVAEA